jgi:hypothetical protein
MQMNDKGLPVPKFMGITSPDICSSFSMRCRDTPLASKKSKTSNISSSIGAIRKEVVMNTAGKVMQMNGYIAGPFQVVLGTHQFSVEIYVAPIEEDMLLVHPCDLCCCIYYSLYLYLYMPCTSTGTLNITSFDSLSTVTAPSSSSSVSQSPILSSTPFSSSSMDSYP